MTKSSKQPTTTEFIIDEEFRDWLDPLPPEIFEALEKDIVKHGCRDPLVIWKEENILIDGYNRYAICKKHKLPYTVHKISFESREDVLLWIWDNQTARRNLTLFQRIEVVLKFKPHIATRAKANQRASGGAVPAKVNKPVDTYETLAKLAKTSPNTVRKVETILQEASKARLDALRKDDGSVSISGVYKELQELKEKIDEESEFTPKKKSSQRSNRVLPRVKREPEPSKEDLEDEIDNAIELFMDIEERLPIDCLNFYVEIERWVGKRKTELAVALVSK